MKRMQALKQHKKALFIASILVIIVLVAAFANWEIQPKTLYASEIRQYQGQNLSSISDVYENAIKGTQYINQSTYRLTVTGLVNRTLEYTYDEVVNNHQKYQKVVTIYCVEGWNAKILWEGILVKDLLQEAGSDPRAQVVIFHASDGYSTALPCGLHHKKQHNDSLQNERTRYSA